MAKKTPRNKELVEVKSVREQLEKVFKAVEKGFQDQSERSDTNCDMWNIWNCEFDGNSTYQGNSQVYLPLTRNAVKARRTRFVNQLFPQSGRNVAVISHDGETPDEQVALIEHYIRRDKLRSLTVPALMVAADVEGQMTVCVTWTKRRRNVIDKIPEPIRMLGIELPSELAEPIEKTRESEYDDEGPSCEIVLDADLCILPATSDTIDEALECGGSVTTLRRWDKKRLEELIDDGELHASSADELLVAIKNAETKDPEKSNLDAAGIKGRGEHALVYRTWTKLYIPGYEEKRLVLAYWAGGDHYLSCRPCPYWCDKPDVITRARDKLGGNIKGQSQIKPGVAAMQYGANAAINEGLDQLTYNLLPPLRYDPNMIQSADQFVLSVMALWPAPKDAIETIKFEQTFPQAMEAVLAAERMINMSLSVSPAMIADLPPNKKMNQAQIAQAQQVAILMSEDDVTETEETMMTEIVDRFARYDMQFRSKEITVMAFGEMGLKAEMVRVPAIQMGHRWEYLWFGVEANRNVQQVQQQIAAANMIIPLTQHPSVAQSGKRFNMTRIIDRIVQSAWSARDIPYIWEDVTAQMTVDPQLENQLLAVGHEVHTSPMDDDPKHMQLHAQLLQSLGPGTTPYFVTSRHLQHHQAQMKMKAMAQVAQAAQAAGPAPAMAAQPGRRGAQPGSQPTMPRQMKQPAGALHPDQMARGGTVVPMPRKM